MRIRLLPEAERDLELGRDFYESQQAGLGRYFTECLASDIDSLALYGGIHEQYLGFHRALSKRFPFVIYYNRHLLQGHRRLRGRLRRARRKARSSSYGCKPGCLSSRAVISGCLAVRFNRQNRAVFPKGLNRPAAGADRGCKRRRSRGTAARVRERRHGRRIHRRAEQLRP